MTSSGRLQDFLSSIIDRKVNFGWAADERSIEDLCRELLSSRGEVSSKRIGAAILNAYENLDDTGRMKFFQYLADDCDIDPELVDKALEQYREQPSAGNLQDLSHAAEPPRQELFRRINHVKDATATLVRMRAHLLETIKLQTDPPGELPSDGDAIKRVDVDLMHLLASWFNPGFLELRPISWQTPADVLAKIIQYEAVHEIKDWEDLKRRLQPHDRRCFAFFHPAMPNEPLVFVEVALTKGTPVSIQDVLSEDREQLIETDIDTAVFYSISNCQSGLRGVSFGNFLIKQVVDDLSQELPHLKTFLTLSPIPGFVRWLERQNRVENPTPEELKSLAATYLVLAKRDNGMPVDPVARFHLSNGALIHQLHMQADHSEKGMEQSHGVMVNYLYEPAKVEERHEQFVKDGKISASRTVRQMTKFEHA